MPAIPSQKDLVERLSPSSRKAFAAAHGLRVQRKEAKLHIPDLLWGLYQKEDGPTAQAFEAAGLDNAAVLEILDLRGAPDPRDVFAELTPLEDISRLNLSDHTKALLSLTYRRKESTRDPTIHTRDLLTSALEFPGCRTLNRVQNALLGESEDSEDNVALERVLDPWWKIDFPNAIDIGLSESLQFVLDLSPDHANSPVDARVVFAATGTTMPASIAPIEESFSAASKRDRHRFASALEAVDTGRIEVLELSDDLMESFSTRILILAPWIAPLTDDEATGIAADIAESAWRHNVISLAVSVPAVDESTDIRVMQMLLSGFIAAKPLPGLNPIVMTYPVMGTVISAKKAVDLTATGTRVPRVWLVTANPKQYEWETAFRQAGVEWTEVHGYQAQRFLHQARLGDLVVAYRSGTNRGIVGTGRIAGEPYLLTEGSQSERFAVHIEMDVLLTEPVTLEAMRSIAPTLDHLQRQRPLSFSPVTVDEWSRIRSLAVAHNPEVANELPDWQMPAGHGIVVEKVMCDVPPEPDAMVQFHLTLRNDGTLVWAPGWQLNVDANLWLAGGDEEIDDPEDTWTWTASVGETVGAGETTTLQPPLEARLPSHPGQYSIHWSVRPTDGDFIEDSPTFTLEIGMSEAPSDSPDPATAPDTSKQATQSVPAEAVDVDGASEVTPVSNKPIRGKSKKPVKEDVPKTTASQDTTPSPAPVDPAQQPGSPAPTQSEQAASTTLLVAADVTLPPLSTGEGRVRIEVQGDSTRLRFGQKVYISRTSLDTSKLLEASSISRERYGEALFRAILNSDHVSPHESTLLGYNGAREAVDGSLGIELFLDPAVPEIRSEKWEYLKDPSRDTPLALNERAPFYRLQGNFRGAMPVAQPLKVLVVICNPSTLDSPVPDYATPLAKQIAALSKIDEDQERAVVAAALDPLCSAVQYEVVTGTDTAPASISRVREKLEAGFHVLHLIAHGLPTERGYALLMEGANRTHELVDSERFTRSALAGEQPLRLVVLAACNSGSHATGEAMQGLGPHLVGAGLPAAIAMQDLVKIETAQLFTQHFYNDLARRGRVDAAMAATRLALFEDGNVRDQWGIPVLFMSSGDGHIFDVDETKANTELPAFKPRVRSYKDLPGRGDPAPRRIQAAARGHGADQETLAMLRQAFGEATQHQTVVGSFSARSSTQAEQPPAAADPGQLRKITAPVSISETKLRTYIRNHSKLKLKADTLRRITSALNAGKHIILIGPPGTGKTTLARDVGMCAEASGFASGCTLTTATADWTTFDTVGGYVPTQSQQLQFRPGVLLEALRTGSWLVIDEINRAEIDKAFGEIFTLLSGQGVELPYRVEGESVRIRPPEALPDWIPADTRTYDYLMHPSWRIIGTMNVYDRSTLFEMSLAFMRRFAFIDVDLPDDYAKLRADFLASTGLSEDARSELLPELNLLFEESNVLMARRALGPAICLDMARYIADRRRQRANAKLPDLLGEAFLLYGVPQLDGLDHDAILEIHSFVRDRFAARPGIQSELLTRIAGLYPHVDFGA